MQKVIQKLQRRVSQSREKGINIMEKIKSLWLGFAGLPNIDFGFPGIDIRYASRSWHKRAGSSFGSRRKQRLLYKCY